MLAELPSRFPIATTRPAWHIHHVLPKMLPHSSSNRRRAADFEKVAKTYEARMMFGKFALLLAGSGALALVFVADTVGSTVVAGTVVLGAACIVSVFFGDFPAFARCPACGKRMHVRRHEGVHRKGSHRYLSCPGCHESVELGADKKRGAKA
jgi:hypothetical protein